jgi:O-antigen/teichoic acid export membrane protein
VVSGLVFFGAPGFARLVHQPEAAPVIRALALIPLVNAIGAVHTTRITRDLGFKILGTRTVIASLLASVAAIILAWRGGGIWALVLRSVIVAVGQTGVAWFALPWIPRLRWDTDAIRRILPTGLRLLGAYLVRQVNGRGVDFFAGIVLGPQALGTLRIAGQTVLMLVELTSGPLTYVGYAVLSRNKDDKALFAHAFEFMGKVSALLIFPAFLGLYAIGDELFPLMFGQRWTGAANLVPLLSALCVPIYFQLMAMVAMFAAGFSNRILQWAIIEAIITIVLAVIGSRFGLIGLVAMSTLRLYCLIPVGMTWLRRDVGLSPLILVKAAAPPALAAAVMTLIVCLAKPWLAGYLSPAGLIAASIGLGTAVYGAMLPLIAGGLLKEVWAMRRQPLASASPAS